MARKVELHLAAPGKRFFGGQTDQNALARLLARHDRPVCLECLHCQAKLLVEFEQFAALAGVAIPVFLKRIGRDPIMGSSVLLTATTDTMGFFIFLGLAAMFLL